MRNLPVVLSCLLFGNWIASVVAFRIGLGLFSSFKVEILPVTFWALWLTNGIFLLQATAFVILSSILLALRTQIGWWMALVVCLLLDFISIAHGLPYIAIKNSLNGDSTSASVLTKPSIGDTGPLMLLTTFLLSQFILATLIFGRRHLIKEKS